MAPERAADEWPITIEEAARRFHCGVRWLKAHASKHGIGRRAGKAIIFTEAEFGALYESLPSPSSTRNVAVTQSVNLSDWQTEKRLRRLLAPKARRKGKQGRRGPRCLRSERIPKVR